MNKPKIESVLPGLYLVDLDLPQLTGFRRFISSWIYTKQGYTLIVDPGPPSTIPLLLAALNALHIKKIDYLLLTHIHMDHGGGAGHLLQAFPETPVLCHPKAITHLTDPQRLWEGSLNVLGVVAEAYGPLQPVAPQNLGYNSRLRVGPFEIEVVETPGHASHHISFLVDGLLFAAELAGVSIPVNGGYMQRPATPPRFIYEISKASLERAAGLKARHLCLGHHGLRSDPDLFFSAAAGQLDLWLNAVRANLTEYHPQNVFEQLVRQDPLLSRFKELPEDIRLRESYFCHNSLRGMYEYVTKEARS